MMLKNKLRRFIVCGLLILGMSASASEQTSNTASDTAEVVMGNIEYELPHELGTLTLQVPLHWVGARADGIEVGWIDQNGSPFKDNVTLSIRNRPKVTNTSGLLDNYIAALIKEVEHLTVSDVEKTEHRRLISFERVMGGLEITQTLLAIYTESADTSYLLALNYSRLKTVKAVDLDRVEIN